MTYLVLIRHGQSQWNLENRFTGNVDIDLTQQGRIEAKLTGDTLKEKDIRFYSAFTSLLKRAEETLQIILQEIHQPDIKIYRDAALNERSYGDLQGLNKADLAEKYGADQIHTWRRSFDVAPPGGESLQDTQNRVLPYYTQHVLPLLQRQQNCMIVAHGNSLRSLMMVLENISADAITQTDIPTGVPRLYEWDENLNLVKADYILK